MRHRVPTRVMFPCVALLALLGASMPAALRAAAVPVAILRYRRPTRA